MTRTTADVSRRSARDRLLDAADELFYEEGVHTVGIDRVIAAAGVAKASLYNTFGSKEELVRAYLLRRHEARQARVSRKLARYDTPRDRLLGVFDVLDELFAEPGFRGCAFLNASAESVPGSSVGAVCDTTRRWMRELFTDLAGEVGAPDPALLAQQLVLLYDGATVSAQLDRDPSAAVAARAMAATLLDAQIS
jgi:AcrR family transcriptional regulator